MLYLNILTPNDTDECQKQSVCGQWPEAGKVPAAAHIYADLIFSQMT